MRSYQRLLPRLDDLVRNCTGHQYSYRPPLFADLPLDSDGGGQPGPQDQPSGGGDGRCGPPAATGRAARLKYGVGRASGCHTVLGGFDGDEEVREPTEVGGGWVTIIESDCLSNPSEGVSSRKKPTQFPKEYGSPIHLIYLAKR